MTLDAATFFGAIGFDQDEVPSGAVELDLNPAFLTVMLAELKPRPGASAAGVRQVVEASDLSEPGYRGHDFQLIASLFPTIRVFQFPGSELSAWNVFFKICLAECEAGGSWIEGELAKTLRDVCALDQSRIPYKVLCRSIFDGDPSSFFLALYRCVEAIYSYASASDLRNALKLVAPWAEIAAVLEDKLSWYPREEGSLSRLLAMASPVDLSLAMRGMNVVLDDTSPANLITVASKHIYGLRNSIVHYRPSNQSVALEKFDWFNLCMAMAGIVLDVYDCVFEDL